jgi:hypothetical protein
MHAAAAELYTRCPRTKDAQRLRTYFFLKITLRAEPGRSHPCALRDEALRDAIAVTLRSVTKLRGTVELTAPGSLPNDGKVIADER